MSDLFNILNPILEKQIDRNCGKGFFKIVRNWRSIVGHDLANLSIPQKISFPSHSNSGILYISVKSGSVSMNIFYNKQKIMSELAVFFGYRAINELKTILQ